MTVRATTIGFGLVNLVVGIESAAESRESLATLCREGHDPVRIQRKAHCPTCAGEPGDTVKARTVGSGKSERYILLEADEVEGAKSLTEPLSANAEVAVHPAADVERDTIPAGTGYFLAPRPGCAPDAYAAIVQLVETTPDKAFVVRLVVRSALGLFRLRARSGALFAEQLAFPADVRPAPTVDAMHLPAGVVAQAKRLVKAAERPWDAAAYADPVRAQLDALVAERQPVDPAATAEGEGGEVIDLMDALRASTEQAKAEGTTTKATTTRRRKAKVS